MMREAGRPPALVLDNPLWRFSLAVYAAPGVKDECLIAQDSANADVNVLLYCAWLGAVHGMALDDAALAEIVDAVEEWSRTAVAPLRAVRRAMKRLPTMDHAEVRVLRQSVAVIEIEAEQIAQALLFALPLRLQERGSEPLVDDLVRANIRAYLGRLQNDVPAGIDGLPHLVRAAVAQACKLDRDGGRT